MHDFLRQMERKAGGEGPPDINVPVTSPERPAEHVLPGGVGTYSIRRAPGARTSTGTAVVKSEWTATEVDARVAAAAAAVELASTSASGRAFVAWEEALPGKEASRELAVRLGADAKNYSEQKPSTPRSKHSATEQRRRSKINDRFQILRGLIPQSDQKRDKASFLLEVIEYIQFLQEKLQKYESEFPGCNQEATNMMPWVKVFFRTSWENARQRTPHMQVDSIGDISQNVKNGHVPINFVNSTHVPLPDVPVMLPNSQALSEPDNVNTCIPNNSVARPISMQPAGAVTAFNQPQRLISESDSIACPTEAHCLRSDMDGAQTLSEHLTIDEGTINVSIAYSQGVMNALTQSLQSSGIDMSQASIQVQINLRRQAVSKPASVATEPEDTCANEVIGNTRSGSSEDESGRARKRSKLARS